jgi:hypothetical protein
MAAKDIATADTPQKQLEAGANLAAKGITDGSSPFLKDLAQQSLEELAPKLFGQYGTRALAVLAGPVAWTATVGGEVLSSTEISRDFPEVIRDTSGRSSLADKQRALAAMTKEYAKYGQNWGKGQVQVLKGMLPNCLSRGEGFISSGQ